MSAPLPASSPPPRLQSLDALRGFALFGILVVNSTAFSSPYSDIVSNDPQFSGLGDIAVRLMITVLFESKFYLLFSFLFGYSFTIQLASAERAGHSPVPSHLRRLGGLLILGTLHACLLYPGDILVLYSLLGLVLLVLHHLPDRAALSLAAVLIAGLALVLAWDGLHLEAAALKEASAEHALWIRQALTDYRGTVQDTILRNTTDWIEDVWVFLAIAQGPNALAMFLLGLVAGRRTLLADGQPDTTMLRTILKVCAPIGLVGEAFYGVGQMSDPLDSASVLMMATGDLTAPFLTVSYAAALLLLFRSPVGRRIQALLAAGGRMALTNYLTQSLCLSILFTGYGFGLIGHLSPAETFGVVTVLYLAQISLSVWWLGRFRMGPVEVLLRAVTRWQAPRLQRT